MKTIMGQKRHDYFKIITIIKSKQVLNHKKKIVISLCCPHPIVLSIGGLENLCIQQRSWISTTKRDGYVKSDRVYHGQISESRDDGIKYLPTGSKGTVGDVTVPTLSLAVLGFSCVM